MLRVQKRYLLLALALAGSLANAGMLLVPARDARIRQANCDRIKEGMTMREVEAILGPPGDYRGWPHPDDPHEIVSITPMFSLWIGEQGTISIAFDRGRAWFIQFSIADEADCRRKRFRKWLHDLPDRFRK